MSATALRPAAASALPSDPRCGVAGPGVGAASCFAADDVDADRERDLAVSSRTPVARRRRKWDDDEIAFLHARYPDADRPVSDIAGLLGRSPASVRAKARRLGLRRARPALDAPPALARSPLPSAPPAPTPGSTPVRVPRPYRVTRLGGRESVWDEDRVRRLIRLWTAGFHHTVVSEVLGIGARAASTKATRISLPARKGANLSRDVQAARRLDATGREVPKALRDAEGKLRLGKHCALTGAWFYGPTGIHTCPEAKQTLHYRRMLGLN